MSLTVRQLKCALAVVDEGGHFGRAAARLGMEAALLTREIRKLEKQSGITLLDRDARPATPTPDGAAFLAEARAVLAVAWRTSAVARAEARLARRRLLLGFNATPLGLYTQTVMDAFSSAIGADVLHLVELPLAEQASAVANGTVDASLIWGPQTLPELQVEHAVCAPRVLAVPLDHALSSRLSVSVHDLQGERCVGFPHHWLGEQWSQWWAVDPRPDGSRVEYVDHARTMCEMLEVVALGSAVAIMSALSADAYARRDLRFLTISDIEPAEILLCNRAENRSPLLAALHEVVVGVRGSHDCALIDRAGTRFDHRQRVGGLR